MKQSPGISKSFAGVFLFLLLLFSSTAIWGDNSYVHRQSDGYEWPVQPEVLESLHKWQDLKFGVLFHWGLYSVPGICESWPLCSEDWVTRPPEFTYQGYKDWYWGLSREFNPVKFDPEQWAEVMSDAGMKYMVFTTKHHDGFCMYDSKFTDFSIAKGPFADNSKRDVAKHVFDAFRNRDFMVGAYYSKPDWHCEWFWNPQYSTPNRKPNYKLEQHPDWWENYRKYTADQLTELADNYGRLDILWLDGGWITGEQIGLDSLLLHARAVNNPGLISVDRTIKGRNENYQTPERAIPDRQINHPWESCIPLSQNWGWDPNADFKSPAEIVALLAETVAKGGSLLLGVGPTPQGLIQPEVANILHEVGNWLRVNGDAIYGTRTTPLYNDGDIWFTASKQGDVIYGIYVPGKDSTNKTRISWQGNLPDSDVILLDGSKKLKKSVKNGVTTIAIPAASTGMPVAFKFKSKSNAIPAYKRSELPVEARIADLIARMTLKEKIGQLCCPLGWDMYEKNGSCVGISRQFRDLMQEAPAGALWAVLRADPWTRKTLDTGLNPALAAEAVNALQRYAVDSTRLGIPLLIAEECPHGHMAIGTTVFPTGLCQAATWNPELIRNMGEAIALEARLQGANIGYGPVLDIARDPRWSRMEESLGEDPALCAAIGTAMMSGMQGENPADGRHLYSTLKHFAAYGASEGGRNGGAVKMGKRELLEEYLIPFRKAVKAGAASVMTSYNSIDGVPCSANGELLGDILRDEWGFKGMVVSDLNSIGAMVSARAANSRKEAAARALRSGVDMDLGADAFGNELEAALAEGLVSMEEIDRAVANVLRLKFEQGLFENPYVDSRKARETVRCAAHRELAREVASQGVVLLSNDGILPLAANVARIAVIGPNADEPYNQLGDYTAPQARSEISTVLDGIAAEFPGAQIEYVKGCSVRDTSKSELERAEQAAARADAAIVVLGGSSARDFKTEYIDTGAAVADAGSLSDMDCGEGFDRATLRLLGDQEELLSRVMATGTPVIVVYIQGRPLDMNLASRANALLTAFYPGEQGGRAIAEIISGKANPAGRLPVSVPRNAGQIPVHYSRLSPTAYMDMPATPLFPFGYGLSYTTFEYSGLEVVPGNSDDVAAVVSCRVRNTGQRDGDEVVQLYFHDNRASVAQPPLQLKAFRRISIPAGEEREVSFTLSRDDLEIYGADLKPHLEGSSRNFFIGAGSADPRLRGTIPLPYTNSIL